MAATLLERVRALCLALPETFERETWEHPTFRVGGGKGKIFYFSPGDQEYPIYHLPDVKRVLANAVQWARPENIADSNPPSVVNSPAPYFDARVVAGGVSS